MDAATLLRLEHAVADIIDLSAADEVFPQLLASVGTALRWPVGAVWLPDASARMHMVASWCASDFAGGPVFLGAGQATELDIGVGLPGRVLQSRLPAWIRDARIDPNFPRAAVANQVGLASAFCFPLLSADGVEGCVEFFADQVLDPSDEVLATTTSLGRRVGEALCRHRLDVGIRRSEARLRAVLEAALDCVVIVDADGLVLEFNPAACATFRLSREEAVGQNMSDLIVPPSLRERHRAGFARYLRTGEPKMLDRRLEITGMRSDGSEFPVELAITRIVTPGPPLFAGYLRDLTERRQAEDEVRAARHRVVQAVVEERQRLERDLHDGAQQRLISVGTVLARARTALPDQPNKAAALLDEAVVGLEQAAIELRDLARGIHPVTLTRYGLSTVLGEVARRSPIDLELGTIPAERYPLAVEATAYFVISEGITNIARHAGTHRARVEVGVEDASLVVVVNDEGPGGATFEGGTGLRGLADRVAMLDGTFDVESPPGGGTRLRARIPISD